MIAEVLEWLDAEFLRPCESIHNTDELLPEAVIACDADRYRGFATDADYLLQTDVSLSYLFGGADVILAPDRSVASLNQFEAAQTSTINVVVCPARSHSMAMWRGL